MIYAGSLVLVDDRGTRAPVESLSRGDLIFNPFSDRQIELAYVVEHTIDSTFCGPSAVRGMQPVEISAGSIARNRPARDLCVLAQQLIYYANRSSEKQAIAEMIKAPASELPFKTRKDMSFTKRRTGVFVAFFTEQTQMIDVEGVLLSTYNSVC